MDQALPRKRLKRSEIREQTRTRLLDAARKVFVRTGIEGFAVDDIAETAGYSRGAFYSHFDTKDDLVCAILEREIHRRQEHLDILFGQDLSPGERLQRLRAYYIGLSNDVEGCMFLTSMHLYSLRNSDVRPKIAALLRADREAVAEYVSLAARELGIEPPFQPEVVALMLIGQAQGLTLSRMVEPDAISQEQAGLTLGSFFDRLVGL